MSLCVSVCVSLCVCVHLSEFVRVLYVCMSFDMCVCDLSVFVHDVCVCADEWC